MGWDDFGISDIIGGLVDSGVPEAADNGSDFVGDLPLSGDTYFGGDPNIAAGEMGGGDLTSTWLQRNTSPEIFEWLKKTPGLLSALSKLGSMYGVGGQGQSSPYKGGPVGEGGAPRAYNFNTPGFSGPFKGPLDYAKENSSFNGFTDFLQRVGPMLYGNRQQGQGQVSG